MIEEPVLPPLADDSNDLATQRTKRENKALREQIAELTAKNQELATSLTGRAPLLSVHPLDETHRAAGCGFHPQVIVSMTTPKVTCSVCGEQLDPIEVLREYARSERRFVSNIDHLQAEKKRLSEEVAKLTKVRSSLSSQIKATQKRLG